MSEHPGSTPFLSARTSAQWLEVPLYLGESVGWKHWVVERPLKLRDPLAAGRVWVPDNRSALCARCQREPQMFHRCHCGWRSTPTPPAPRTLLRPNPNTTVVFGAVGLRGLVVRGEGGLIRAEYERPLAVYSRSIEPRDLEKIAGALRVYAHPSLSSIDSALAQMSSLTPRTPAGLSRWELI